MHRELGIELGIEAADLAGHRSRARGTGTRGLGCAENQPRSCDPVFRIRIGPSCLIAYPSQVTRLLRADAPLIP